MKKLVLVTLHVVAGIAALGFMFAAVSGCDRAVGGCPNENSNLNNNATQPELLTPQIAYVQTVNELMGFQLDLGTPCSPPYPDVEADSPLCRAIRILEDYFNVSVGHADGHFGSNEHVLQAEMWKVVALFVGFLSFPTGCELVPDIPSDTWYAFYAGSHCTKALMILQSDGLAHPADNATLYTWYNFIAGVKEYLNAPATRGDGVEAIASLMLKTYALTPCTSSYGDVADDSLICGASNTLLDEGLLDPSQHNLRQNDPIMWPELIMLLVQVVGLPAGACTGCSGTPCDEWSAGWADAACEAGVLPEGYDPHGVVPTKSDVFRTTYNFMPLLP